MTYEKFISRILYLYEILLQAIALNLIKLLCRYINRVWIGDIFRSVNKNSENRIISTG